MLVNVLLHELQPRGFREQFMTGTQLSLDDFSHDTPQDIISRVQKRAREAIATQNGCSVEVSA